MRKILGGIFFLISLVLLCSTELSNCSKKEKIVTKKEKEIQYIIKHDTVKIVKIKEVPHYIKKVSKGTQKEIEKSFPKKLDSIAENNNIKKEQIEDNFTANVKLGAFSDEFGEEDCSNNFKVEGTLYWEYKHKFPILRKLWDSKIYNLSISTDCDKVKIDSVNSLKIERK